MSQVPINSIKWETLSDPVYQDVVDYYTGLIAFRKAHPALRMSTAREVSEKITLLPGLDFNVIGFHIAAGANGEDSGDESLGTAEGTVEVLPIRTMVLVQAGEAPEAPTGPMVVEPVPKGNDSLWLVVAAVGLTVVVAAVVMLKKKK